MMSFLTSFSYTTVLTIALVVFAFPSWHIQWLSTLIYYFFIRTPPSPFETKTPFAIVTRTKRCSLFDYDINRHKSNSTYFQDTDIVVVELISRLTSKGFNLRRKKGKLAFPRLGGVAGVFLKEIRLFQKYELRTRIVAWDEKWIYVMTKFESPAAKGKTVEKKTFAIMLSKIIFKQGRLTVAPETPFEESELMPVPDKALAGCIKCSSEKVSVEGAAPGNNWCRECIEKERKRGLGLVENMLAVEKLRGEVTDDVEGGMTILKSLFEIS